MMNYKPKKLGLPSSTGIVKPPTLPAPPAPRAPAPVAAPPIVKPPLAYKPPAPPSNSGVVKPTNLPPPINEPLDRRGAPTLPNDRPAPVVPPPTPAPPPLNYKPPIAPAPILPGDVPMPNKGGAQRPEPPRTNEPKVPMPNTIPTIPTERGGSPLPAPIPAPPPVPVPDRGFPTRPDPVNPNNGPTKDGSIPVDPSRGKGQVPDTDPRSEKYVRRNETTEQRIKRLEAKLRARGGKDADLEARIAKLKKRLADGELKPADPSQDKPKTGTPRVQLDDDPSTWTPEMLAELALPRGMDTIFYDNPNSSDKVKTAKRIADKNEGGGDGSGDNAKVNQTRQGETTQERIARLQAKLKGASKEKKAQLKARIAKLKARRDGGENTPKPDQGKNKPTPTSQVPDAKKDKQNNKDTNETRQDEDLEDRLSRLRAKLKGMKANDPKRKQLEQRIKDLEARIKQGDKKGSSTKNQPGTPERSYRNREVSSRPFNYGGEIRI
jgi:hypothetical protein